MVAYRRKPAVQWAESKGSIFGERNSPHRKEAPMSLIKRRMTEAALAARRANAKKSTGPRTEAGKARSRFNALKHGRNSLLARKYFRFWLESQVEGIRPGPGSNAAKMPVPLSCSHGPEKWRVQLLREYLFSVAPYLAARSRPPGLKTRKKES